MSGFNECTSLHAFVFQSTHVSRTEPRCRPIKRNGYLETLTGQGSKWIYGNIRGHLHRHFAGALPYESGFARSNEEVE
jgi:hypothetical protein